MSVNTPQAINDSLREAAVLVPITNEEKPKLIFTKRSQQMKTHGGQVAFPGGMKEHKDSALKATALRESKEEIGLDGHSINVVGALNQVLSKHNIKVSPFVGLVEPSVELLPCPKEIESIFRVPIDFFLTNPPSRFDSLQRQGGQLSAPCWFYDGYEIWGMTAYIVSDFFRVVFEF